MLQVNMYMEYTSYGNCEDECNVVDTDVTKDSRLLGGGETRA